MSGHLDGFGGQESTSASHTGGDNTGQRQGENPTLGQLGLNTDTTLDARDPGALTGHTASAGRKDSQDGEQDAAMRTRSSTMTDVEATATSFTSSSRTGRRNALPDIRSSGASSEALELPEQLQTLSVKEEVQQKNKETTQDQLESPKEEK
ncbi:cAMP-dependent protein kinase inhibitor beta isoform X2 [Cavia porcellus]|uniref:cAMP-dependent protein kinase inhibitor beta isoform X2 n=1 Tax=Cavia porcellus TaxID=10141 RepID=UPI000661C961|nr:cAMP-dependent protein kinase inhibitor beta isoform X2 [Cavia porcellus]